MGDVTMQLRHLFFAVSGLLSATAGAASFTALGGLPDAGFSDAFAISADGTVVVGQAAVPFSNFHAFRWTAGGGMVDLGTYPNSFPFGVSSRANAVSADGSIVLGTSDGSPLSGAFRWTQATGLAPIAAGQGRRVPNAVSYDGSVIVGTNSQTIEAFRWTASDGFLALGDLPGGPVRSSAYGVSGDGLVVVGNSVVDDSFNYWAFRWTAADGMVALNDPGGSIRSTAYSASADGSVIVGVRDSEAFRWTSATGMVGLGDLPGSNFDSQANGVSADGSVIVGTGYSSANNGRDAFIWTASGGMQRLLDVLIAQGATGLQGWTLETATAVSADGSAVVGLARNASGQGNAYLARVTVVPVPAAFWLFSAALGALGWLRGRAVRF